MQGVVVNDKLGEVQHSQASTTEDVRAFMVLNRSVLGQPRSDEKPNVVAVRPGRLSSLTLRGALLSIDVRGPQHAINKKVSAKEGANVASEKDKSAPEPRQRKLSTW